ncbi:histidinol-phosphate transaminase [Embleya sp. NPDC127516]|uniref:histidinol-phosphate transaminase n=1 Tax=Embleya sp. NPDC127516 TaxID=3363990 RepID=UPI00381B078A
MNEVLRLARPDILALETYVTGRDDADVAGVSVYLDANESPYPPFAHGGESGGDGPWPSNRYPEPQPAWLLERFASHYETSPARLLVSRGAEEAISLLVRAFCEARVDHVVVNPPTFGMYEVAARIHGAGVRAVPLLTGDGFRLDVDGILDAASSGVKLVFVCTPNNPTGTPVPGEDVMRLAEALRGKALVVADETYLEFHGAASLGGLVGRRPNLVVLRTLSKAYGLAGERCGVTIAHPQVIAILRKVLAPYPLTQSSLRVLSRALSPEGITHAHENILRVRAERTRMEAALARTPAVLRVHPSVTNFVLFETRDPTLLVKHLHAAGVKVRDRSDQPGLDRCVRVTIGTPAENNAMLAAVHRFSPTGEHISSAARPEPAAGAISVRDPH